MMKKSYLFAFFILISFYFVTISDNDFLAAVFFRDSISTKDLLKKYDKSSSEIKILIVPGHDDKNFGAAYGNIKESDMNLEVAGELYKLLNKNKNFEAELIRKRDGYDDHFIEYLSDNYEDIHKNVQSQKQKMNQLIADGKIDSNITVHHNFAKPEVAQILNGINHYANKKDFDIVLHIHFNDYPGRVGSNGKHSGFAIYVPEKQYSNAKASKAVAESVANRLSNFFAESSMPQESAVTEDQELIAIGANNTLDAVSLLMEYGYIYERQFQDNLIKDLIFKELANQTYLGLIDFFEENDSINNEGFEFANRYSFDRNLMIGDTGEDVLALQVLLNKRGFYPKTDLNDCPINGFFGDCTKEAILDFQKEKKLDITGFFDKNIQKSLH